MYGACSEEYEYNEWMPTMNTMNITLIQLCKAMIPTEYKIAPVSVYRYDWN